jgi:hypothetical protein
MLYHHREFRRNGYCTQLCVSDIDYDRICVWCNDRFGDKYACRYHTWENLGEWQFYTRSDFAEFSLMWGGISAPPNPFDDVNSYSTV